MLEAISTFFTTLFSESGNLILLFFVTGIVFNVFTEVVKKQIWPKYTEEEISAGKKQKSCPEWMGMIFGIFLTIVFIFCTLMAYHSGVPHCSLIGGYYFIPVWCVAYYIWQMAAMKFVKMVMRKLFPVFMTGGNRPPRPQRPKVYKVPAGATVEYVGETPDNGDIDG